jgi:hypothetical protein
MRSHLIAATLIVSSSLLIGQEKEPPQDSSRVSVTGCVRGRSLITSPRSAEETVSAISAGRRFRLSGKKKLVDEIRAHKGQLVAVTGLVKKSQLSPATSGVPLGGSGRVRIGGGPPNRDPTLDPARDPLVNEPVMDVESWRGLPEPCPAQ